MVFATDMMRKLLVGGYKMTKVYEFLATGFEETEMIVPADLLRRAGIEVCLVSITGELAVTGTHDLTITADKKYEEIDFLDGDMLILPGGQPGTQNLCEYKPLQGLLKTWNDEGKRIAAICAAPTFLAKLGLLKGKRATCYPACEEQILGANISTETVVTDGNITTSRGVGTAIDFAVEIIRLLVDEKTVK